MKRCYEVEWGEWATKQNGGFISYKGTEQRKPRTYNACGSAIRIGGIYYCPRGGRLRDYVGWCAAIEPPEADRNIDGQMTLLQEE